MSSKKKNNSKNFSIALLFGFCLCMELENGITPG